MEVLRRIDYLIKRVFSDEIPSYAIEQANQEVQQENRHRQTTLVLCACETKPHVFTRVKRIVISVHLNSMFI